MVSGRISFEITQKAAVAGIPVVAGISAASSLAVDLAVDVGMTLAGFVRGEEMVVYAGARRPQRPRLSLGGRQTGSHQAGDPFGHILRRNLHGVQIAAGGQFHQTGCELPGTDRDPIRDAYQFGVGEFDTRPLPAVIQESLHPRL